VTWVENHQVGGIKAPPDIIYPNSDESFRLVQIIEGLAATTNDNGFTLMNILEKR
jgi:hypothetical protein